MLVVFGSVAFDTIRTPTKVLKCEMGGAATYASISASFFTKTGLLAVIGKDFPKKYSNVLAKRMNLRGLSIKDGKTFRYDGKYDKTLENRTTLKTELNVLGDFKANVPDEYKKSKFVYLANNDPEQNRRVLGEFDKVKFSMCDTIDFWIHTKRAAVKKMIFLRGYSLCKSRISHFESSRSHWCWRLFCRSRYRTYGKRWILFSGGDKKSHHVW